MGKKRPAPPIPSEPPAPLTPVFTGQFKRDVKRIESRGKDMAKLQAVVRTIVERSPLERARVDHRLHGEWKGCRDCHVEGDWVLIYETTDSEAIFHRTGTHSDLGF